MKSTKYSNFCLDIFGNIVSKYKKGWFAGREIVLEKANISIVFEEFYALAIMNMLIGFCLGLIIAILLFLLLLPSFIILIILPIAVPVCIGVVYLYIPSSRAKQRSESIDRCLPYALNFMSTMAVAGIAPIEIFRVLAEVEVYGEIQNEAIRIVKEIDVMGMDTITALEHDIDISPSKKFKSFLQGVIGTIQSGSDLQVYLSDVTEKYMEDDLIIRKKSLDLLEGISDIFIVAVIAFPIFLVVMLSTMSFMSSSGSFSPIILYLFSFMALPMAYIGFYELIKLVNVEEISKVKKKEKISFIQYYKKNKGYIKVFMFSICSILTIYLLIWMMLNYGLFDFNAFYFFDIIFITLLFLIGPIGFYIFLQDKKMHEIKERLPDFFVKIGNSVSSGSTVIEAIRVASKDNFGRLTKEILVMKSQLSWNISTRDVFINFIERMESTHIKRMFVAVNKALESGGNISRVFKAAAKEIDQVNRIEDQRKANMSGVTMSILMSFFSFLAIIIIINNTIFTAFFNQQDQMISAAGLSFSIVDEMYLKYALFSFVIVQSMGSGILGGFMRDGKLSSGVRFSFVLGLISLFVFKTII